MDQSSLNNLNFKIDLEPIGDTESVFRYRNSPGEVQRPIILDRHTSVRSDLAIQGTLDTVIHGTLTPTGPKATLIVARFQFLSSQPSRMFSSADASICFRDKEGSVSFAVVDRIAPSGQYCLNPSFSEVERKLGVGVNAGINSIGSAGGKTTYELTKTIKRQDSGSLYGVLKTDGRNYGPRNAAKWTMSQNDAQKNGIPAVLRVAILLRRQHDRPFFADVKVKAEVDIFYRLECRAHNLSGSDKIDPIVFDPLHPPMGDIPKGLKTDRLSEYDLEGLGGVDIIRKLQTV